MKHLAPTRVLCTAAVWACLGAGLPTAVSAADFSFSGDIRFHNDVVQIDFSLAEPTAQVRLWTDSWLGGLNFDPAGAVWAATGNSDYSLLSEVDDDDSVAPGQGFYDTGFVLNNLMAGNYRVTLVAAFNAANGTLLSQGFSYDSETPILLTAWNQPSFDPNANDQKGGFWRLNLSGVSQASVVPEPAAWQLLAVGLLLGVWLRARRRD